MTTRIDTGVKPDGPITPPDADIYEGQFGTFTIDESDRTEVVQYRAGLVTAASSFCLLYTSPSPRDGLLSRMPSSA